MHGVAAVADPALLGRLTAGDVAIWRTRFRRTQLKHERGPSRPRAGVTPVTALRRPAAHARRKIQTSPHQPHLQTLDLIKCCVYKEMVDGETAEDAFFRMFGEAAAELRQGFARWIGMSAQRVQVLVRLHRAGETSHSELRQALGVDGASITRLVKELEHDGLTQRRVDPADNRYTLASLTPAGVQLAAELRERHQAYQKRLLEGIGRQDQERVLQTLRSLRDNLNQGDT